MLKKTRKNAPQAPKGPEGEAGRSERDPSETGRKKIPMQLDAHNARKMLISRELEQRAVDLKIAGKTNVEIAKELGVAVRSARRILTRAANRSADGADVLRATMDARLERRLKVLDGVVAASRVALVRHDQVCEECKKLEVVRVPTLKAIDVVERAKSAIDRTKRAIQGLDAPIIVKHEVEEELREFLGRLESALDRATYEKVLSAYLAGAGQAGAYEAPARGSSEPN